MLKHGKEMLSVKKKLFIEELEERQSSAPLFVCPIVDPKPIDLPITTMALGEEGGWDYWLHK